MHAGNAANAKLNGEHAKHVAAFEKRQTAKKRRQQARLITKDAISSLDS